jgi:uncharacterized glyoxalase superfamily protein PhnB
VSIYAALTYRDVPAAIAWLELAFGLEGHLEAAGGAILRYGDGMVMVETERPEDLHGSHTGKAWIYLVVDDADRHYERSKAAGAEVLGEPHDYGAGFRGYSARDIEGNLWSFGTERPVWP